MDARKIPLTARVKAVWEQTADPLLAACCLLLSLALYLHTLAPSVAALYDDSLEFPLVVHRLAIAHPTGYPLYTLLARLLCLGPWYNVAWSVNLLSALAAAVTVALVYLVARSLARPPRRVRRLPAVVGALSLAVSPVFWSQAVVAEVYSLHAAFVAALLWLALRWARRPLAAVRPFALILAPPAQRRPLFLPRPGLWVRMPPALRRAGRRARAAYRRLLPAVRPRRRLQPHPSIYLLAAAYGLALAHHRTALLLAPALLAFVLLVEPRLLSRRALLGPEHPQRRRWQQIAGRPVVLLLLALLGPLLLYLYLPLRGEVGSLDGTYRNTWSGFWLWVTAGSYSAFFADNPLARDLDAAFYGRLFWQQFGPLGLALAFVGLVGLARARSALPSMALTGVAFLVFLAFALVYRVPDVEVFFIPAFLVVALWLAAGLDYAARLLRPRGSSLALRRLQAACGLLVVLGALAQPLSIAVRTYPDVDLSRRWIVHDWGLYVLDESLPGGRGTVVGLLGEMTLLRYFQETVGAAPWLETVAADDESERRAAVEAALAGDGSVYVTRPLPGLAEDHALDAVTGLIDVLGELETLIRVGAPGDEAPPIPRAVNAEPVPGLELLGYGLYQHAGHWQAWARLRLWWRAPAGLDAPLKISARLLEPGRQVVAVADAEPVAGAYPTTAWRPGEVVVDAYELLLPAGLPPGDYVPVVIVYEPETGAELGRVELAPVTLAAHTELPPRRALEASLAHLAGARFRDLTLVGWTPPGADVAYRSGDALPLTLLWQARGPAAGDWQVSFFLEGAGHHILIGREPVGGPHPAAHWQGRQAVRQWPVLRLPAATPPGDYRLVMRVECDGRPVPWGRGWIPRGSDFPLGRIAVAD
jgi:hypothetical protein